MTAPISASSIPPATAAAAPATPTARRYGLRWGTLGLAALVACGGALAQASRYPITPDQRSTAQQVAQAGVPLSELSPSAPDRYTVKRGDTLWDISSLFLQRPWRWPELWGMNLQQIQNPHLIYPGQVLVLTRIGDRATLSLHQPGGIPTVKLSPHIRAENLADTAIAPIALNVIEPFLAEPIIVDKATYDWAPRIVATQEGRVLLSRGDRAYARGQYNADGTLKGLALSDAKGEPREFRVFRNAVPITDPTTGEVLAHEAQFIGQAVLARGESRLGNGGPALQGQPPAEVVPATIDIVLAKEEMRVGDRLLPEPPREVPTYVPRAPQSAQSGQIAALHGSPVRYAGQHQVVVLNRGTRDGLERGHVLAILKDSKVVPDRTDGQQPLALPGERNGLMMVFRAFDRVSYALVLQITDGVKVGDRFTQP